MTGVFFASQNTFILRGKTTFAYPFIQFFLGQCLRGGEMFLIFLPIFLILSPNEFQELYVYEVEEIGSENDNRSNYGCYDGSTRICK